MLGLRAGAVATSGTYERGTHIRDPHTGLAPEGVLSVTIVGPDLAVADAYATAAFAMGRAGAEWAARLPDHGAIIIFDDATISYSAGVEPYLIGGAPWTRWRGGLPDDALTASARCQRERRWRLIRSLGRRA